METTRAETDAQTAEWTRAGLALVETLTTLIPAQKFAVTGSSWAEASVTMATQRVAMAVTQAATLRKAGDASTHLLQAVISASPSVKMDSLLAGKSAMTAHHQQRAMAMAAAALAK